MYHMTIEHEQPTKQPTKKKYISWSLVLILVSLCRTVYTTFSLSYDNDEVATMQYYGGGSSSSHQRRLSDANHLDNDAPRPNNQQYDDFSSSMAAQYHDGNIIPLPHGWKQSRKYFKCNDYGHDKTKPLPTLEFWQRLRADYIKYVDPTYTFDDEVPPTQGYDFDDNGLPPPYYAGHGDRGRGLFASRDIKAGELVHDGNKSDIRFPNGMSWHRLVFNVPRRVACDIIDWSWVQQSEEGEYELYSAINISILFNGGNTRTMNVNPPSGTSSKFHALCDIKKDEELLTDYDIYDTKWKAVGL